MPTRSNSGSLSPVVVSEDKERLRVYQENEAHPAAGFSSTCDLECALDGGSGDPRPVREGSLTHLHGHAYHLRAPHLRHSVSLQDGTTRRVATHRAANPFLDAG